MLKIAAYALGFMIIGAISMFIWILLQLPHLDDPENDLWDDPEDDPL